MLELASANSLLKSEAFSWQADSKTDKSDLKLLLQTSIDSSFDEQAEADIAAIKIIYLQIFIKKLLELILHISTSQLNTAY